MRKIATPAAALAALAFAGGLRAHHSGYMYETAAVWIKGTVVRIERVNPHTLISLEDRNESGQVLRWAVEGPGQSQLERMGIAADGPSVGDVIEFCAFPYKPVEELSRMFPGVDFSARRAAAGASNSSPQFVAGHVMVMADGEKRLWEPHGLLSECIRSSADPWRSWLDFLDTSARARDAWCEQRRYTHVSSTAALVELVESIDGSLAEPCE